MFAFLRSTRPKGHKRPDPSVTLRLCDHVTALSALRELGDCFSDAIGLVSTRLGEFAERLLGLLMKPERSRLLHLVTASQLHDLLSVSQLGLRRFAAVDIASIPDSGNLNPLCFVVDSIENAIVAATKAPQAAQLPNKGSSGAPR
jgi:hypothetical protein